jgi:hypothetical protein
MRFRTKLTATLTLAATLAASAAAYGQSVPIALYSFATQADVTAFVKQSGPKCAKSWQQMKQMAVTLGAGTNACAFQTTVVSDSSDIAADMDVSATVALGARTPTKLMTKAFVGVAARSSETSGYELRVRPAAQTWQLFRDPKGTPGPVLFRSGKGAFIKSGTPVKKPPAKEPQQMAGKSAPAEEEAPAKKPAAKPAKNANNVSLQVFDGGTTTTTVTGIINGKSVVTFTDSAPDQPDGRRSVVVTGVKGARPGPGVVGVFDNVAIRVPSPF